MRPNMASAGDPVSFVSIDSASAGSGGGASPKTVR